MTMYDLVVITIEQRDGAASAENVVVRMGSEQQDGFVLQVLQALRRLRPGILVRNGESQR